VWVGDGLAFHPPRRRVRGPHALWKFLGNRCLTVFNSILLGTWLSEFHTGYRVYKAEMVRGVPYQEQFRRLSFQLRDYCSVNLLRIGSRKSSFLSLLQGSLVQQLYWHHQIALGTVGASIKFRIEKLRLVKLPDFQSGFGNVDCANPQGRRSLHHILYVRAR